MPVVYLIPTVLAPDMLETIPAYVLDAIRDCQVLFAEQERTSRRFLKALDREIVIDDFQWYGIHKAEEEQLNAFRQQVKAGKNIGIISEAGCPGIADPGQALIALAQEMGCTIRPLVGPSSILLALMASGMNGQHFEFCGYLPIEAGERIKKLRELEASSRKDHSTKIFIETPYRNGAMVESILKNCDPLTRLCIGVNITASNEFIRTMPVRNWAGKVPELHKQPAIFLMQA